jgi:signal transduction histidine kinase
MSVDLGIEFARSRSWKSLRSAYLPVMVAVIYFIAAEIAFYLGTLSDRIFAPFWPPNIVLFCALLASPMRRWHHFLLAVFPAHAIAEIGVSMPPLPLLIAFVTNCGVAATSAYAMQRLIGGPPWLNGLRKATIYVMTAALVSPSLWAFLGALVPLLSGGALEHYPAYWAQWYAANALAGLTLGPLAIILFCERRNLPQLLPSRHFIEFALLNIGLALACLIAFQAGGSRIIGAFLPTALYMPLPLFLWSAARFGGMGVSVSIFIATVVAIWCGLDGPSPFTSGNAEANVFALQTFLIGLSAPLILLGAAVDDSRRSAVDTRDAEQRMAFVAASANIGLWQLSDGGRNFWATEYCRTMLGFSSTAIVTWDDVLRCAYPDDRDIVVRTLEEARQSSEGAICEFRVTGARVPTRWFAMVAHVERDNEEGCSRVSGLFSDITLRKNSAAELELQRRELAHLMRVATMGELSGALAHELNQPLTAILANAEAARRMIAKGNVDLPEIQEMLNDIVSDNNRAGEVIQRLHRLLRKGDHKSEPVDLNDLVSSTMKLVHSQLINRRIKAHVVLCPDLPMPVGDAVQLQQVLLNIIMNAIEAMSTIQPLRRTLKIETRIVSEGSIEAVVIDQGPGLTGEQQKRLFEPFFTTKNHGLGLGLSICSTIVAAHGGQIRVTDNGNGTTAVITLPVANPSVSAEAS